MAESFNFLGDKLQRSGIYDTEAYKRTGSLLESINRSLEFVQDNKTFYQPGESKSNNHLIYEMNEFYIDMMQKINDMSLHRTDNCVDEDEDVPDRDSVLYDVVTAIKKKRNNPEMRRQIESVLKLDKLMESTFTNLKKERSERMRVQNELCELIDQEDISSSHSGCFRRLCDLESGKSNTSLNEIDWDISREVQPKPANVNKMQGVHKKKAKFIKRNIQLAKNTPTMFNSTYSFTDAEKARLRELLTDLDKIDDNESQTTLTSSTDGASETTTYPFSLSQDEKSRLRELESKLEKLSQCSQQSADSSKSSIVFPNRPEAKKKSSKVETGWKEDECKQRLKEIEAQLQKLQSERESFTYQPSQIVLPREIGYSPHKSSDNDNDNDTIDDIEPIPYDILHARSQDLLKRIEGVIKQGSSVLTDNDDILNFEEHKNDDKDDAPDYSDYENDEPVRD